MASGRIDEVAAPRPNTFYEGAPPPIYGKSVEILGLVGMEVNGLKVTLTEIIARVSSGHWKGH